MSLAHFHLTGPRAAGALLFFVLLASAVPADGQETAADTPRSHPASFPHLLVVDLRDVLGAPLSWRSPQWERFSLAVAGVGAVALADRWVRDAEARDHNRLVGQVTHHFESLGSGAAFGILGTFYVVGLVGHDEKSRNVGEDGVIASVIAGGIITPVLKYAVGRERPRDTAKTFDFKPFGGSSSFPSGHATEAFAVASVIASDYDSGWVKGAAYGSAVLVAFARVHHQAHFASDVTAGALIGSSVGRAVVHRNRDERARYALAPIAGPHGEPGMAVVFGF